jgi:hypothetical protein
MFRSLLNSIIIIALSCHAAMADEPLPFRPGEKLHYTVYWTTIEAAEATLEILPMEKIDGKAAWHFAMTAKTSPLAESIYPVHDRIDSYADADMDHALQYKERKQTRKLKDVSIVFDWKKKTASYSGNKGKKKKPVDLQPGAFDPLSIFYFFRMHELTQNLEISRPVSDGKSCVMGKARVVGRQKVLVSGKEFDTWLVEPELGKIGGVFEKSPNAKLQIWVTADKRRIPIRVKSEVVVGSFTAELDSIEQK